MPGRWRGAWELLKETYGEWTRDNALRLGAALSYYTVFSLPAVLVLAVAIGGVAYGRAAAREQIVMQVRGLIGPKGAEAIRTILEHTGGAPSAVATVVGAVLLAVGATAVFAELQGALNTIWGIREKPGRTIRSFLRTRVLSFVMVLGVGLVLLAFLVLSALASALGGLVQDHVRLPPGALAAFRALDVLVSLPVATLLFAMAYKILPYARIAWRDVWLGAAVTAFLFTIGKFFVGLYLGASGIISAYRAVGSLIILFVWIYFSAQIFFLGAEFTQVYARRRDRRIEPSENAEWISKPPPGAGDGA